MAYVIEREKTEIIEHFNRTACDYPKERTIVELFEAQVAKTPDKIATVFEGSALTYAQLNEKAELLAKKLRRMGVKPNDFVAILAQRGNEMLIALYGILKSGAAYVPLDVSYPSERIAYMLQDCAAKAVVVYRTQVDTQLPVIDLSVSIEENAGTLPAVNQPSDIAYLIYTSGTTGKPKAVMVEHRNVVNYCTQNGCGVFRYTEGCETIMSVTNIVFDIFVTEAILSLLNGMTIYLANGDEQMDAEAFLALENTCRAQALQTTPSRLQMFLAQKPTDERYRHFKYIMLGGESVSEQLVHKLRALCPEARIIDVYGPSETTVWSSCADVTDGSVNIGKPISNTQIYILNERKLCDIGEVGELCIAGDGVTRGYLNRPELTKEKFVQNPYAGGRLYRTGDLAKWLPDGNIEFLGRIDEQVKIRGYRIELGEIESTLRSLAQIQNCAVIVREDAQGEKAICAYLVSTQTVNLTQTRALLAELLPPHMVPTYMMQIDAIPMNQNGKLDKKALPQIEAATSVDLPENALQAQICDAFAQVLGLQGVGIHDRFFDIGGHSLRVIKLINRLEKLFAVRCTQNEIFQNQTPKLLSALLQEKRGCEDTQIPLAQERDYYPMSSAQQRMYLASQMGEDNTSYNLPMAWRIEGNIDIDRLKSAFAKIHERHEILRTEFKLLNGEGVQKILPQVEPNFRYYRDEITAQETLLKSFVRVFDLSKAPLVRMELIERKDHYLLLIDLHHIIGDGMSMETFCAELASLYNGEILPPLNRQYKDYSQWMRSRDLSAQRAYWLAQFKDEIPCLDLPLDHKRPQRQSYRGAMLFHCLSSTVCNRIREIAQAYSATEYMVFLSAMMILLSKYSRQEDIVIGSAFGGRTHADTEPMLGMFVNALAIRAKPSKDKTFAVFLEEIKQLCLAAYENQEYPFDHLVEALGLRREVSRNPLFDVMLVMQNNDHAHFAMQGLQIESIRMDNPGATFDFTFNIEEDKGNYSIGMQYCTDLFREESAKGILNHFTAILEQLTDLDEPIGTMCALTAEESERILHCFNNTQAPYPADKTIVELFEAQAQKSPKATAVTCENAHITYEELNAKANRIAHTLRLIGVKPNETVALLTKRSIEMIAAVYGVLKSGAAYVPIDPTYPTDRISFMLEDCKPKAIVLYGAQIDTQLPIVNLEEEASLSEETSNPVHCNVPTDLAYCIYTSGTTGKPKGVLLEHHGVANLKAYFQNQFQVDENDNVLQFANYVFDGSVWEMNMALLNGARLVIATNKLDIPVFEEMFRRENITIASLPPNFYAQLNDVCPRTLITAGSAADAGIVEKAKNSRYVNSYGPTECTVAATHWEFEGDLSRIPIGKPIQNAQVYILQGETLCGIGVPGELCISGVGLARGYLNRPELTAEKFANNPFAEGRLYRTGDLARWLPDGNIEFLGRADEQVKIRGFRVELGEIEYALRKNETISDCAVIVRENSHGENAIYAYVVSSETVDFEKIRAQLRQALPDYMIPAYMMQLENIPVTTNGKLDKRALPEIVLRSDSEYIPPRNPAEKALCEAFEEILDVSCVSVKDSFFEFGGDSIKAIRVVSKVREKSFSLSVKDIMENATVEQIAMFADPLEQNSYMQEEVLGTVPDTPMLLQFKKWNLQKPQHFNQAVMLKLAAGEKIIDKALHAILKQHDMLRAVWRNGQLKIMPYDERVEFSVHDFTGHDEPQTAVLQEAERLQASFDLENGPLMKSALFKTPMGDRLMICIHHLVVDGISWQILTDDLFLAIEQQTNGKEIDLPAKTASYIQWAALLQEYRSSGKLDAERSYWQRIASQLSENTLQLQRRPEKTVAHAQVSFTQEETEKLLLDAGRAYHTQINDLLLSALAMTVNELTGQEKIAVCLEGHGREDLHQKLAIDRTIGWFTSAYPVILDCSQNTETVIVETKEMLRKLPNHGIGYGLLYPPICDTPIDLYFNYLGESEQADDFSYGTCVAKENRFAGEINFDGSIINGVLSFEVSCNQATFDEAVARSFAECYREKLTQIIHFCTESEDERKTLADVDADDLDEADFDEINAILGLF